jgi:hypothetical protein
MKLSLSLLGISFALGLSAIAAAQAAEPVAVQVPAQVAVQPSAVTGETEQESFSAYKANVNPSVEVRTSGDYDQEDLFVGPTGFPLNGWKEVSNPPS